MRGEKVEKAVIYEIKGLILQDLCGSKLNRQVLGQPRGVTTAVHLHSLVGFRLDSVSYNIIPLFLFPYVYYFILEVSKMFYFPALWP